MNSTITGLESITESECLHGYLFVKYEDHVVFHKIVLNEIHSPEVAACIRVDEITCEIVPEGFPCPTPTKI